MIYAFIMLIALNIVKVLFALAVVYFNIYVKKCLVGCV